VVFWSSGRASRWTGKNGQPRKSGWVGQDREKKVMLPNVLGGGSAQKRKRGKGGRGKERINRSILKPEMARQELHRVEESQRNQVQGRIGGLKQRIGTQKFYSIL